MGKHGGKASPSAAPSHIASLTNVSTLTSVCGRKIAVWELSVKVGDALVSDWARHFRQSYCADGDIDLLRLDLSRKDYLTTMVFPHATQKPGPSIRSGDFAELLISDFLEYVQGFWVPRYKYSDKASPNESVMGLSLSSKLGCCWTCCMTQISLRAKRGPTGLSGSTGRKARLRRSCWEN